MGGQSRPPLRVQCKYPGECVIRCHSHRSRFTPVLARQRLSLLSVVPIQAARSSMWRGDCRVVAGTLDSGTCRHAEAECTTRLQRLFLPTFSGKTEKVGLRSYSTDAANMWASAPTGAVVIVSMGGCRHPPLQDAAKSRVWAHSEIRADSGVRAYLPTQKRSKIRFVISSRTTLPVTSPMAVMASSTSVRTASGVIPARIEPSADSMAFPARASAEA